MWKVPPPQIISLPIKKKRKKLWIEILCLNGVHFSMYYFFISLLLYLHSSSSFRYSYLNFIDVSLQFSHSVMSNSLRPHEPQHARPPCPSPTPGVHPNPCPLSQWCHPTISSSIVLFSSCSQSFPASGSFQISQPFASGGQSIGVSASTSGLPMNTQDWSPLGWTGWISLQSKGLSRIFFNTTVQKHQYFGTQPSSQSSSHIYTWLLEKL